MPTCLPYERDVKMNLYVLHSYYSTLIQKDNNPQFFFTKFNEEQNPKAQHITFLIKYKTMNVSKKAITAILFFTLIGTITKAQESNFSNTLTLGVGTQLSEKGVGWHIGYNPSFSLSKYFALEGQLSYANMSLKSPYTPSQSAQYQSVNALIGGRFYFTSPHKKVRPYVNLLLGGAYEHISVSQLNTNLNSIYSDVNLGYSVGAFVDINRFTLGVSYDAPKNALFKIGYRF